jgi:hypothetical protein
VPAKAARGRLARRATDPAVVTAPSVVQASAAARSSCMCSARFEALFEKGRDAILAGAVASAL